MFIFSAWQETHKEVRLYLLVILVLAYTRLIERILLRVVQLDKLVLIRCSIVGSKIVVYLVVCSHKAHEFCCLAQLRTMHVAMYVPVFAPRFFKMVIVS